MIRDLERADAPIELTADVVVIGAGVAGLLLATRLSRAGKRVVVLESGGLRQEGDHHPLNEVVHRRSVYAGAAEGRFRCLGGTSTRWAGGMIPFVAADLRGWPIAIEELTGYLPEVERMFSLPPGPYDLPRMVTRMDGAEPAFVARMVKWPTFHRRNVATLLHRELESANGTEVWLRAHTTGFCMGEGGRVVGVEARAGDLARLTVKAGEVVIAAGGIESTRLLLLLDRATDNRAMAPHGVIGRNFHDHISALVARVVPHDFRRLNRALGYRLYRSGMRRMRFETAQSTSVRARIPPGYAQIALTGERQSGFDTLRQLYRRLQRRELPNPEMILGLAGSAPWLLRAGWWRLAEHRLLYPRHAALEIDLAIEQDPIATNRITLSSSKRDRFGQPLAEIDWGVSDGDVDSMQASARLFEEEWDNSSLARLGRLVMHPSDAIARAARSSGGMYHPGGSTRMGRSASEGVVDKDLRVFGVPNMSVVSTSTFPTAGAANPTMMLMMAALRAADRLAAIPS